MPRYLRYPDGTVYFFTLAAFERRTIFCQTDFLAALKTAIREVRQLYSFEIIAWVQLPDHLHCILRFPQSGTDFGKIWSMIKCRTTQSCPQYHLTAHVLSVSKNRRHERGIWQRRFYEHMIRNDNDLQNHMDYIHYNPVKHGWAQRAADWPHSTFHRYVRAGVYPEDWGGCVVLGHIDD